MRWYLAALMARPPAVQALRVPSPDGRYGPAGGEAMSLVLLGDSLSVGVGVRRRWETPGAQLARGIVEKTGRAVELRVLGRAGATTGQLRRQVRALSGVPVGTAVIIVGCNDVLLPVRLGRAAARLGRVAAGLRAAGWQVAVLPCVDWSAAPGLRRWIRATAIRRSRRLAALQRRAAGEAGVRVGTLPVDDFRARPAELFSPDGCHPSAAGYALQSARAVGDMFWTGP
ncbi:SGNH/GDSL hydrolase family protein [Streptomyces sp. NPDC049577]|uniref:SGNH/GDSL hydrolase family protein n=1 Tax=Streptomyces sp. NPDC049577 TaxID=3155153 RepID=UPI0034428450